MIEILNKSDVKNVKNQELKKYLDYSFKRLPQNFDYPSDGYFVIIETFEELIGEFIQLSKAQIPSLSTGLYDEINMVEIKDEIMEVLVFLDNDISVSLILKMNILSSTDQDKLRGYVLC
jgi:hypothetical protein